MTDRLPTDPTRDPNVKGEGEDLEQHAAERTEQPGSDDASGSGGQVSETNSLAGAGEPISDSQSVGGQPDLDPGRADEGPQGPNAVTGNEMPDGPVADRDDVTGG